MVGHVLEHDIIFSRSVGVDGSHGDGERCNDVSR